MARFLRSLSGSLAAAPTPRSILAPHLKARGCDYPPRQRQPGFTCNSVLNHAAKYCPAFPPKGFADLDAARQWAASFVHWYNALVQSRASPQRHPLCHAGGASWRTRPAAACSPSRALSGRSRAQSETLEPSDPELDTNHSRDTQPRAGRRGPGRLGPEPIKHTKQRGRINKAHYACHAATCLTFTGVLTEAKGYRETPL